MNKPDPTHPGPVVISRFGSATVAMTALLAVIRNGLGQNRSGIGADNIHHLAIAAVVVPLVGLVGVAAGAYHLVRRPVVIRPGVKYLVEGEVAENGEPR